MVTIRILDQGSNVSNIEQSCIEHNSIQIHMYVKSNSTYVKLKNQLGQYSAGNISKILCMGQQTLVFN